MSNIDEAADRRDKQRDKDRQRELAQRAFRYERFQGVRDPREKMHREMVPPVRLLEVPSLCGDCERR
jgi:hypothetical protein